MSGLASEFALSQLPDLATLEVELYQDEDNESFVRALEIDVDFAYQIEGNLLRFENEQVPPSNHFVVARYRILPAGVDLAVRNDL